MNWTNIIKAALDTLLMTSISTVFAYLIGLPVGVLLYVTSKKGLKPNSTLNMVVGTIVNIFRSIPCLLLIIILIPVTNLIIGKGEWSGSWYSMVIPLIVASFGFVSRMVEQSLSEVDNGKIEAVQSLGATKFQIITKVLLPETRASLISGLAVTLVSILGYTSFAYNIGAGGLIAGIWKFYSKNTGDYLSEPFFWIMIVIVILIVQGIQ